MRNGTSNQWSLHPERYSVTQWSLPVQSPCGFFPNFYATLELFHLSTAELHSTCLYSHSCTTQIQLKLSGKKLWVFLLHKTSQKSYKRLQENSHTVGILSPSSSMMMFHNCMDFGPSGTTYIKNDFCNKQCKIIFSQGYENSVDKLY